MVKGPQDTGGKKRARVDETLRYCPPPPSVAPGGHVERLTPSSRAVAATPRRSLSEVRPGMPPGKLAWAGLAALCLVTLGMTAARWRLDQTSRAAGQGDGAHAAVASSLAAAAAPPTARDAQPGATVSSPFPSPTPASPPLGAPVVQVRQLPAHDPSTSVDASTPAEAELDPVRQAARLSRRANRYTARGRYGEAEQLYREALALRDRYPAALFGLARVLMLQDKAPGEALRLARRAARARPELAAYRQLLGDALRQIGDEEAARAAYAAADVLRRPAGRPLEQPTEDADSDAPAPESPAGGSQP